MTSSALVAAPASSSKKRKLTPKANPFTKSKKAVTIDVDAPGVLSPPVLGQGYSLDLMRMEGKKSADAISMIFWT